MDVRKIILALTLTCSIISLSACNDDSESITPHSEAVIGGAATVGGDGESDEAME